MTEEENAGCSPNLYDLLLMLPYYIASSGLALDAEVMIDNKTEDLVDHVGQDRFTTRFKTCGTIFKHFF